MHDCSLLFSKVLDGPVQRRHKRQSVLNIPVDTTQSYTRLVLAKESNGAELFQFSELAR